MAWLADAEAALGPLRPLADGLVAARAQRRAVAAPRHGVPPGVGASGGAAGVGVEQMWRGWCGLRVGHERSTSKLQ